MPTVIPPIEHFWALKQFEPNDNQKAAIRHTKGPLFLMAGPGSGKTRVLLWRTLNLIVYHHVKPEEIFLATFTEKATQQLQEGLRTLLGLITQETGEPYDISKMRLGTVHSICQKIIPDRDFSPLGVKNQVPVLMDGNTLLFTAVPYGKNSVLPPDSRMLPLSPMMNWEI